MTQTPESDLFRSLFSLVDGRSRDARGSGIASLVLASSSDRIVFDGSLDFTKSDFRKHPQLDRIGRSDHGVLPIEPCRILPHWRFKIPAEAKKSSAKIFRMLLAYLKGGDFPGADMARKFLQMAGPDRGVTRTTRGPRVQSDDGRDPPRTTDPQKA